MKNNMLKKPLISSVLILALLSTLLYLLAGNPEATVWSSLGVMIRGILRSVQWLIAMLLALIACLAFLFAVFFGAVALFDRETAARMYQNFKTVLMTWTSACTGACTVPCCTAPCPQQIPEEETEEEEEEEEEEAVTVQQYEAMNAQMSAELNSIQGHLHTTRQILTDKIDQLNVRIENLETMTADMAGKQQLDTLSHEVRNAMDSLSGVQNAVSVMQSAVDQTADQIQEISSEKILGDLPGRIRSLEEQQAAAELHEPVDITLLRNDIKMMQTDLSEVKEKADKALQTATECSAAPVIQEAQDASPESTAGTPTPEQSAVTSEQDSEQEQKREEEHRIFSYFNNQADKEKLVVLVQSALKKNMSYKQALNYIVKEFGPDKGKIISSHPSLSKDYIRQCRKKS